MKTATDGQTGRKTICVSTQAGCAMGCVFCVTGQFGFARNLEAGEVVEQVLRFSTPTEPVTNVVFMGMGEPLANYAETLRAIRLLIHPDGLHLGARRITLSTSGLVPQMRRLADEHLAIGLAISLHAPVDELRSELMPVNRRWPIAEVLGAIGLIAPGVARIRTGLTPLAAGGLVIIMIGATAVTCALGPAAPAVIPFTVALLAASVAWGRRHALAGHIQRIAD